MQQSIYWVGGRYHEAVTHATFVALFPVKVLAKYEVAHHGYKSQIHQPKEDSTIILFIIDTHQVWHA